MVRKFFPEPEHDIDDLTSHDYPDYTDDIPQEQLHAAEIPFDVDDDRDPTLRLECSICGASFAACECLGGPKKLWTPGPLPFEMLNPKDADQ
jgi:hypothetical protein